MHVKFENVWLLIASGQENWQCWDFLLIFIFSMNLIVEATFYRFVFVS